MNHKKIILSLIIITSLLTGILAITLLQPQQNTPIIPPKGTPIQIAKTPTINNLTQEMLQAWPSALQNSTDALATDFFNESFFNLTPPSGQYILGQAAVIQAHVAQQPPTTQTHIFGPIPPGANISQIWNMTGGGAIVLVNSSDPNATSDALGNATQYFNEFQQELNTTYGIIVQANGSATIISFPIPGTIAAVQSFTSLNSSAEVYNTLYGIIPAGTWSKTIAGENSPSHLVGIEDTNYTGFFTSVTSVSIAGATIDGKIGWNGIAYTFSTRNLLGISPSSNITSLAPMSGINITLPTGDQIINYYPPTASISTTPPSISYGATPLNIEDVNITYTALSQESLQVWPSALQNSTDALATDSLSEAFFNLAIPSDVPNVFVAIVSIQAHSVGQALNFSAPDTNIFPTMGVASFSPASGTPFSLIWNETIGVIEVAVTGTDASAAQNASIAANELFNEFQQELNNTYGIIAQKVFNMTTIVPVPGVPATAGFLFFITLNSSAQVYNALNGIIPPSTFAKTLAGENSPSHQIAIEDMYMNFAGSLQTSSRLSVGATIDGQIGWNGSAYTFSTRSLLNITSPSSNITSPASYGTISIILPTTSNITNYYPTTAYEGPWLETLPLVTPTITYQVNPINVDDVNVTYTLGSTVPYLVANYSMTDWNMNPGDTANLTLTLTNVGTATAYNVYPYLNILNSTVMNFTDGYTYPPYSSSPSVGPFDITVGASVVIDYNVTAINNGIATVNSYFDFMTSPSGTSITEYSGGFNVHVGSGPLILFSTNCSSWVVSPEDTVSIYFTATNVGTDTAYNVTVPSIPTLGQVIDSNVTLPEMGFVGTQWVLGDLTAGSSITANVTSEVDYPSFHTGGAPSMRTGSVLGYGLSPTVFMPLTLPGLRPATAAHLVFNKQPQLVTVSVNDNITVNVTVQNLGTQTEWVNITDIVPTDYFTVSAGSTSTGAYVTSGGSLTLIYTLTAIKAGTVELPPPEIGQNYTFTTYCTGNVTGIVYHPSVTITYPSSGAWLSSGTFTVTWSSISSPNVAYYLVSVDGAAPVNVSLATSYPVSGLLDGSHTVNVTAVNMAGLSGSSVVSFGVDTTPPTVTITNPSNGEMFNTASVTVNWTGSDDTGIAYFEVRIDGGSWINKSTSLSHTFTSLSTNASHTVDVVAFDLAGNNALATVSFFVDTTASTYTTIVPAGVNQLVNASAETGVELTLNLSRPISLSISNTTNNFGGSVPSGLTFLGQFVYISANDTQAITGLTITMHYDPQVVANLGLSESSLQISYWNTTSGNWTQLSSTVDTVTHTVSAHLDHLTLFTNIGSPPSAPPASFIPILISVLTQQGLPMLYIAIGGVAAAVIVVAGVVLALRRRK